MFLIAKQNRCLRRFRANGATAPSAAVALDLLGLRDTRVLRRLVRQGVIEITTGNRFYLVQANAELFLERRRRSALVALAAAAVVAGTWLAAKWPS